MTEFKHGLLHVERGSGEAPVISSFIERIKFASEQNRSQSLHDTARYFYAQFFFFFTLFSSFSFLLSFQVAYLI